MAGAVMVATRCSVVCVPPLRVPVFLLEKGRGLDEVTEQFLEPSVTETVPFVQEEVFEQPPQLAVDLDMIFPQEPVSELVVERVVSAVVPVPQILPSLRTVSGADC